MIPQSNPGASYLAYKDEIDSAIQRVLTSGWYILGQEVESFEKEFAAYIGVEHAIGVANGTDALELALRACGVEAGDSVITVSHTAVATASAISRIGAKPIFVDIDEDFLISSSGLKEVLKMSSSIRPKAIIVVHLYGQPADMPSLVELANEYGMVVIEDCAQAHGALLHNRRVGSWGGIGCFSFYPTKNLGALGDGGAVVTDDSKLADKVTMLRQYGWRQRYISDEKGLNSRLDELQAAVLRVKLRGLDMANQKRREIASCYRHKLEGSSIISPQEKPVCNHVYHQFVIQSTQRDLLAMKLMNSGVATAIHYPAAVHQQPAYSNNKYCPMQLLVTERIVSQILSLPIFPEMHIRDACYVADAILNAQNEFS